MEIGSASAAYLPRPAGVDGIAPAVSLPAPPTSEPLSPAAKVDLGSGGSPPPEASVQTRTPGDGERRRFSLDADSRELVFQVYDQTSGTVVDQLPSESAVRARAYARDLAEQQSARAAASKAVDRNA